VDKEDINLVRTLLTSVISNSEVRVAMLAKRFPLLELQMFEVNAVGLATVREDPDIVQTLLEFGANPEDVEEVCSSSNESVRMSSFLLQRSSNYDCCDILCSISYITKVRSVPFISLLSG
jgi:hypothetical protein